MQPTLVILAAGSGTRYGGLKQLDPVDSAGNTLLEHAVRDSAEAGFKHFVLVIRKEHASQFKTDVLPRMPCFDVQLAFQTFDEHTRKKPWGTAHALLCARHKISGPFAVVNGDDWYGTLAYQLMFDFLCNRVTAQRLAMVGFHLGNTLSPNGTVSRGICTLDDNRQLQSVVERSSLQRVNSKIIDLDSQQALSYPAETIVSMNFWGFHPGIFHALEESFLRFTQSQHAAVNSEFYLPAFVDELIQTNRAKVDVMVSDEQWHGITYAADRQLVSLHLDACAAARCFLPGASRMSIKPLAGGLVHRTQRIDTDTNSYVLQQFNQSVFRHPAGVRENYLIARKHLLKSAYPFDIPAFHGNAIAYTTLPGTDDALWRICDFITGTECFPIAPSHDHVEAAGWAFGMFLTHLQELDPTLLATTIPDFHDPVSRSQQFGRALNNAVKERKTSASFAIESLLEQQRSIDTQFTSLPVRATHNDCKLSNLLFDAGATTVRAVIDWDTLMPGVVVTDFGDMVRTLCTTTSEEEADPANVDFDVTAYQRLHQGFLDATQSWLGNEERQQLANGAVYIVYEQAMRFLGDYLAGDVYYAASHASHNLDRALNQLALLNKLRRCLCV